MFYKLLLFTSPVYYYMYDVPPAAAQDTTPPNAQEIKGNVNGFLP